MRISDWISDVCSSDLTKKQEPKTSPKESAASGDKTESDAGKVKRTDDGSVALALLQGRTPKQPQSKPAEAEQDKYALQIAAYSTNQDAQARRDRLIAAGVTNAYVDRKSVVWGKRG